MLPGFEIVARRRPVDLIAPGSVLADVRYDEAPAGVSHATPHPAPYAAVCADLVRQPGSRLSLDLSGGALRLSGWYDGPRRVVGLEVATPGRVTGHRSRRMGRVAGPVDRLAVTLTGTHLTVLTRQDGRWTARGRVDLRRRLQTRDEAWLATLRSGFRWLGRGPAPVGRFRAGGFGQLGLRDLRVVTTETGEAYRPDGRVLLTATSAGPGFFDTAHTSVWQLDVADLALEHVSDLFFRRPGRPGVFGDHATHLVRTSDDDWLVATSTWGDFDPHRRGRGVMVTVASTTEDLLTGRHVLDTTRLALPTTGLRSVGVWDPHLVRDNGTWHVGYVNAPRFFSFHPVVATGPTLDSLRLRAATSDRIATEGTTLVRLDGDLRVLASDGRSGRTGHRRRYPVFDLDLTDLGALDAPYPTNIPWPTLVREGDGWLLVTFDGTPYGGPLISYGSHGDVVVARTRR